MTTSVQLAKNFKVSYVVIASVFSVQHLTASKATDANLFCVMSLFILSISARNVLFILSILARNVLVWLLAGLLQGWRRLGTEKEIRTPRKI
jgi:hypothetical protein